MGEALGSSDLAVLPVDELAIWLLRVLLANHDGAFLKSASLASVLKGVRERVPSDRAYRRDGPGEKSPHLAKALAEAWAWLESQGLIAEAVAGFMAFPLEDYFFVTRHGEQVAAHDRPIEWISAESRLGYKLHPRLEKRARRQFILGEFEAAVLVAMKEVEIAVRGLSGLPETIIGTDLMNRAFGDDGPLTDLTAPIPERQGVQSLFRAAIAVFKNPASHRRVVLDDPIEAAEVVLFADLLLRMLDRTSSTPCEAQMND